MEEGESSLSELLKWHTSTGVAVQGGKTLSQKAGLTGSQTRYAEALLPYYLSGEERLERRSSEQVSASSAFVVDKHASDPSHTDKELEKSLRQLQAQNLEGLRLKRLARLRSIETACEEMAQADESSSEGAAPIGGMFYVSP